MSPSEMADIANDWLIRFGQAAHEKEWRVEKVPQMEGPRCAVRMFSAGFRATLILDSVTGDLTYLCLRPI
jgi:hypothetical protein